MNTLSQDTGIGLIVFLIYFLVVTFVGIIAARYQNSSEDFWIAGRRFGLTILVIANMAAILNGGALISGAGYAAKFGGVAILPFFGFALGIAIVFFWIAKKLRDYGGITLPDYMGDRFDSRALRAWSAAVIAFSSIIYLIRANSRYGVSYWKPCCRSPFFGAYSLAR